MHKSDIEIAQGTAIAPISEIAAQLCIPPDQLIPYGSNKAKVALPYLQQLDTKSPGKLILVTAINPTPFGEGKTTTTVGLGDGLKAIGKQPVIALREPSLGPVFGLKGGAAGGGRAQVVPMEDINLHFTGDFHAISAAANLLAAMLDNHIKQGNKLQIDSTTISFKRVVDMNDRALRDVITGLGGLNNGVLIQTGFEITVACEVMAIFCLASSITDLKERLAKIIVANNHKGEAVTAGDLKAAGAMTALLKDALAPNLVQTLEGTPAFVHGGPFANIAHGCNSVIATKAAMALGDYCITEAGFGADLGAEKFFDIKCRAAGLVPDAVVLVATVRALKHHGSKFVNDANSLAALEAGLPNLERHIHNITQVYGLPCVVAINRFVKDTTAEVELISQAVNALGVKVALSESWEFGGQGGIELAYKVVALTEAQAAKPDFRFAYNDSLSIPEKLKVLATRVYGAANVSISAVAQAKIEAYAAKGLDKLPICVAKTQYSFSDNPDLLAAPSDFTITLRDIKLAAGAGFLVCYCGNVLTMPGLPEHPAAESIDCDATGKITGLF